MLVCVCRVCVCVRARVLLEGGTDSGDEVFATAPPPPRHQHIDVHMFAAREYVSLGPGASLGLTVRC